MLPVKIEVHFTPGAVEVEAEMVPFIVDEVEGLRGRRKFERARGEECSWLPASGSLLPCERSAWFERHGRHASSWPGAAVRGTLQDRMLRETRSGRIRLMKMGVSLLRSECGPNQTSSVISAEGAGSPVSSPR